MNQPHSSESMQVWLSTYGTLNHETAGFTLPLAELTREQLLNLKPISQAFIQAAPRAFGLFVPTFHPTLRNIVAYLTELHERQAKAWIEYRQELAADEFDVNAILSAPPEARAELTKRWLSKQ